LTNPNSRHGAIFFINRASEVPPVVEKIGLTLVIFLIIFLAKKMFFPGFVKKESPFSRKFSL